MLDLETITELRSGYKLPSDAGPEWRKAAEMGMDMTLIECNLEMTPWERLLQNDRALAMVQEIRRCNPIDYGEPC